jgi:hypothetical protein
MVGAPVVGDAESIVRNASRSLGRLLDRDDTAVDVLANLDTRVVVDRTSPDALVRWKSHEFLRIAARDLVGIDELDRIGAALAAMAADVFAAAVELAEADGLAVIGMGKLGGRELNYSSDVDVMLVMGEALDASVVERRARAAVEIARRCFRVDLNLRPEGRNGAAVSPETPPARPPPPPTARSCARSRRTRRTGTSGPSRGSSRRCSRRGPSRVTARWARRSTNRRRAIFGRARSRPSRSGRCGR